MNLSNGKAQKNNNHLIEVRSISFKYNNNARRALSNVSFFVDQGERIAILGHNGSGKSTLVKILGALLDPDEGFYFIDGQNLKDINPKKLRSTIGMVFQDPENQIVAAMVQDDIAFSPENQGLPSNEIQERVDKALNATGLQHKKNCCSRIIRRRKTKISYCRSFGFSCKMLDTRRTYSHVRSSRTARR